jgi:hypothetical protein
MPAPGAPSRRVRRLTVSTDRIRFRTRRVIRGQPRSLHRPVVTKFQTEGVTSTSSAEGRHCNFPLRIYRPASALLLLSCANRPPVTELDDRMGRISTTIRGAALPMRHHACPREVTSDRGRASWVFPLGRTELFRHARGADLRSAHQARRLRCSCPFGKRACEASAPLSKLPGHLDGRGMAKWKTPEGALQTG